MSDLLLQIADSTNLKQGFSFIVSGHDSRITTRFNPPIQLKNGRNYYSFPNIHPGNNVLRYSPDNGTTWHTVALSTGSSRTSTMRFSGNGGLTVIGLRSSSAPIPAH